MFDRKGYRKYLNNAERQTFHGETLNEPDAARRALCLTLFHTGCRISEALNLSVERIDLAGKALVIETLKRRKRGCFRSVPIPDDLVALLAGMIAGQKGSAKAWAWSRPTAYRLVTSIMRKAGIAGSMASPKGLRHGFAVACIEANIPLTTVQKWLGHARLETTAIYLQVSGSEERDFARRLWRATSENPLI